jgi:hypothetical protein
MHTIETRLGEYKNEVYSFIKTEVKEKLLVAPTGTGKTYTIIQFAKDNPQLKLALLCPTQSLVKNIGEDYRGVPCGFGSEFLDKNRFSDFIVTTYDSIETLENMDYIFIDEAHQMASDGSYRKVIAKILESEFKKVFISATPEIIEDYIPNTEGSRLDFEIHRPKQEVKIFYGKYNIKGIISDIINNTKGLDKTILIRINNKEIIESIYDSFKPIFKEKIARIYSDEDNVLYDNQNVDVIDNLKVGNISNVDIVLCTSIYDAGLSFKVDRDIQAYAVSQDTRKMPNPVDMVQFLARVRGNSGYNMSLTIIGNYGDYELITMDLPKYKSMQRLCNLMAFRYEEYREMEFGSYHYILNRYNINVTEVTDLGFKPSKVIHSSRVSYKDIAQNFQSFSKEYNIVSSNLDNDQQRYQIELITGDKTLGGGSNTRVQRVFNHLLYATKYKIPFECFFNESYSLEVFNMLEKLNEDYKDSIEDIFSNMINNIVYPSSSVLKYKELGYKDLIKADAKVVRQVYNVFYKSHDFRGKEVKLIDKKEGSVEVKKYLYDLTRGANVYSMTAPLTAPLYDF